MDFLIDLIGPLLSEDVGSGPKAMPGWMYLILGGISLFSWLGAKQLTARINRTKNDAKRALFTHNTLKASAVINEGKTRIQATINLKDNLYVVCICRYESSELLARDETQFTSLEMVAQFLEAQTVLRLSDFK